MAKDWTMNAAIEICKLKGSERYEGYVSEIIGKHCPMLPDVAYMPVPRCDSCGHWELDPAYMDPVGRCLNKESKIGSDCNDYTIMTDADFGCVQWKAQE